MVQLSVIEQESAFQEALAEVAKLQQPVLDRVSAGIRETLKEFLPNVKQVRVGIPQEARYRALRRSCEIVVDDGTPTHLARKGYGVQSLAALSLMRQASDSLASGKHLILAIEEPESHFPDGHLNFPHLWPGQIPPGATTGTRGLLLGIVALYKTVGSLFETIAFSSELDEHAAVHETIEDG